MYTLKVNGGDALVTATADFETIWTSPPLLCPSFSHSDKLNLTYQVQPLQRLVTLSPEHPHATISGVGTFVNRPSLNTMIDFSDPKSVIIQLPEQPQRLKGEGAITINAMRSTTIKFGGKSTPDKVCGMPPCKLLVVDSRCAAEVL